MGDGKGRGDIRPDQEETMNIGQTNIEETKHSVTRQALFQYTQGKRNASVVAAEGHVIKNCVSWALIE